MEIESNNDSDSDKEDSGFSSEDQEKEKNENKYPIICMFSLFGAKTYLEINEKPTMQQYIKGKNKKEFEKIKSELEFLKKKIVLEKQIHAKESNWYVHFRKEKVRFVFDKLSKWTLKEKAMFYCIAKLLSLDFDLFFITTFKKKENGIFGTESFGVVSRE